MTRDDVFATWLSRCKAHGFASGQSLREDLQAWARGRFFVDSSDADSLLRDAEQAGTIQRARNASGGFTLEPTFTQRAFGIGGGRWNAGPTAYRHLYGWCVT